MDQELKQNFKELNHKTLNKSTLRKMKRQKERQKNMDKNDNMMSPKNGGKKLFLEDKQITNGQKLFQNPNEVERSAILSNSKLNSTLKSRRPNMDKLDGIQISNFMSYESKNE